MGAGLGSFRSVYRSLPVCERTYIVIIMRQIKQCGLEITMPEYDVGGGHGWICKVRQE
jgi:hypothetical protein